jgi:hypothetical protein
MKASLYLSAAEFDLEVFGRLLGDATPEVELVNLRVLVPERRLVVHYHVTSTRHARTPVDVSLRVRLVTNFTQLQTSRSKIYIIKYS